jgi:hypothetical protein
LAIFPASTRDCANHRRQRNHEGDAASQRSNVPLRSLLLAPRQRNSGAIFHGVREVIREDASLGWGAATHGLTVRSIRSRAARVKPSPNASGGCRPSLTMLYCLNALVPDYRDIRQNQLKFRNLDMHRILGRSLRIAAFGMAALISSGARSAILDLTFTGTVQSGIDSLGTFGYGYSLRGAPFTATYIVNNALGYYSESPVTYDGANGTSYTNYGGSYYSAPDPIVSESLTINNNTLVFSPDYQGKTEIYLYPSENTGIILGSGASLSTNGSTFNETFLDTGAHFLNPITSLSQSINTATFD